MSPFSIRLLVPDCRVDRVTDIPLSELRAQGVDVLLIDLDNTLTHWRGQKIEERVKSWVWSARAEGFRIALVSNASSRRLAPHGEFLGIEDIYPRATKPSPKALSKALKKFGVEAGQAAMVGDQVFTDVLAGNRLGLCTVLVTPIDPNEQWWMRVVRALERRLLDWLAKVL